MKKANQKKIQLLKSILLKTIIQFNPKASQTTIIQL